MVKMFVSIKTWKTSWFCHSDISRVVASNCTFTFALSVIQTLLQEALHFSKVRLQGVMYFKIMHSMDPVVKVQLAAL
jgi:hypothetical protein